ncbi:MAG TPA: HmuY family protein [Gemmatimonadales bacterium]|nr:HmuY family protein [Gemmatimonadales bacterium]
MAWSRVAVWRQGLARPPVLVVVLGVAFVLLMGALVIGSLATPEFPPYTPTTPAPAPVGDSLLGPLEYTLDASAPDRWRRFDFSRNAVVDSGSWDLAFRRTHVIGGEGVGILDLGPVPFDAIIEVPDSGYLVLGTAADTSHPAVGKWYDYNYLTHLLRSRRHVYAVRTARGRYAKFEILNYYCRAVGTACVTFRYAYQGDGSRVVGR